MKKKNNGQNAPLHIAGESNELVFELLRAPTSVTDHNLLGYLVSNGVDTWAEAGLWGWGLLLLLLLLGAHQVVKRRSALDQSVQCLLDAGAIEVDARGGAGGRWPNGGAGPRPRGMP